jgi:hypothetical protein
MTNEEINRAVAESVGWMMHPSVKSVWRTPEQCETNRRLIGTVSGPWSTESSGPPDYCNSYDAIMPLVKALNKGREEGFVDKLMRVIYPEEDGVAWRVAYHRTECHALITATPRQLCEAYLAVGGADA